MDTNNFDPPPPPGDNDEPHDAAKEMPRVRKGSIPRGGKPKKKDPTKQAEARRRLAALASARTLPDREATVAEAVLARVLVDADLVDAEALATQRCWVQYRQWTPLQKTEQYARDYVDAYRPLEAARTGKPAEAFRPLEPDLMLESPDVIAAASTGRVHADLLGLPYPVFIRTAMEHSIGNGKADGLPRPNQLYGKLTEALFRGRTRLDNAREALDQLVGDPRYQAVNYRGDPDQVEVVSMVCEMIHAAERPAEALALFMGTFGMLPPSVVLDSFPSAMVAEAVSLARPNSHVHAEIPPYLPGCFGYRAKDPENVCLRCPAAVACSDASSAVRKKLMEKFGTDRPKEYFERRTAAARSQRYRDRKKAKEAAREAERRALEAERLAKLEGMDRVRALIKREKVKVEEMLRDIKRERVFFVPEDDDG
jgi:hypothetical protein